MTTQGNGGWYYSIGPVSDEQIQSLVAENVLTPHSLVWNEAMQGWTPLHQTPLGAQVRTGPRPAASVPATRHPAHNPGNGTSHFPDHQPRQNAGIPLTYSGYEDEIARASILFRDNRNLLSWINLFFLTVASVKILAGFALLGIPEVTTPLNLFGYLLSLFDGHGILSIFYLIVLLIIFVFAAICSFGAVIAYLIFVYRSNNNAILLSRRPLNIGSGWAVGWFFVPVAQIFMPCFVMQQIWNASIDQSRQRDGNGASYFFFAWIILISVNTAGIVVGSVSGFVAAARGADVITFPISPGFYGVMTLLEAVSACLALLAAHAIASQQTAKYWRMGRR